MYHVTKELVENFRDALDQLDWPIMPMQFREFPRGACGDISDILVEFLYTHDIQSIDYVCGRLGDNTHAWLEIEENVIDITADQFPEITEPVLFQSPQIWHSKYEISNRRKAGYKHCKDPAISDIRTVRNGVIQVLNT